MDNKKCIQEMLDKITDEKPLKLSGTLCGFLILERMREKKMDYKKMIIEILNKVQS